MKKREKMSVSERVKVFRQEKKRKKRQKRHDRKIANYRKQLLNGVVGELETEEVHNG